MADYAGQIVELQRQIQQSFLMIVANCEMKIPLYHKLTDSVSTEFQLGRTIEALTIEVAEVKGMKVEKRYVEVFNKEMALIEQSAARLKGILDLMNATKSLRCMKAGDESELLIERTQSEFDAMRKAYPFDKEDIEARAAHIVFLRFWAVVTDIRPIKEPIKTETESAKRQQKENLPEVLKLCSEAQAKIIAIMKLPVSSLHMFEENEQQKVVSTEERLSNINLAGETTGLSGFLSTEALEKCKISDRAYKTLGIITDLMKLTASENLTNHVVIARTVSVILQLFNLRAEPVEHCGTDSVIFYNDCLFLALGVERAKIEHIYKLKQSTIAFNFGSDMTTLRKAGRSVIMRDLKFIKTNYLSWSSNAMDKYLARTDNEFKRVLLQLKRWTSLWDDVCSKRAYACLIFIVCLHILMLLIETLGKLPDFERATCFRVLPIVKEVVEACSKHIREAEIIYNDKFIKMKPSRNLEKRVDSFKRDLVNRGVDRSLVESFDFKLAG